MTQSSSKAGSARTSGRISSRRSKSSGPERYDFRRPTKLSREHVRTLQIAYETFARQYTTLLTTRLRVVSQVTLVSIEQLSYDEYIASLTNPTILALCTLEPLPGTTIMELSLSTAMVCIDHLLGGPGGPQPERPLTDIELPLLSSLLDRTLVELQRALEPIVDVQPKMTAIEYNPQFVQPNAMSDAVVVVSFDMRVGAEDCLATICMPFSAIFPRLQADRADIVLTDVQRAARETAQHNLVAGLERAPIEVAVRFQAVKMHPADLVNLRAGDVVPLAHPTSTPLAITGAGITFAHAVPGSQGTKLACLVVPSPASKSAKPSSPALPPLGDFRR